MLRECTARAVLVALLVPLTLLRLWLCVATVEPAGIQAGLLQALEQVPQPLPRFCCLPPQGSTSGWLLDPDTMQLLGAAQPGSGTSTSNTGGAGGSGTGAETPPQRALRMFRALHALQAPNTGSPGCPYLHTRFLTGSCAFTIKWAQQFKVGGGPRVGSRACVPSACPLDDGQGTPVHPSCWCLVFTICRLGAWQVSRILQGQAVTSTCPACALCLCPRLPSCSTLSCAAAWAWLRCPAGRRCGTELHAHGCPATATPACRKQQRMGRCAACSGPLRRRHQPGNRVSRCARCAPTQHVPCGWFPSS